MRPDLVLCVGASGRVSLPDSLLTGASLSPHVRSRCSNESEDDAVPFSVGLTRSLATVVSSADRVNGDLVSVAGEGRAGAARASVLGRGVQMDEAVPGETGTVSGDCGGP